MICCVVKDVYGKTFEDGEIYMWQFITVCTQFVIKPFKHVQTRKLRAKN